MDNNLIYNIELEKIIVRAKLQVLSEKIVKWDFSNISSLLAQERLDAFKQLRKLENLEKQFR